MKVHNGQRLPAMHGVRLLLDATSAHALTPWLDTTPASDNSPVVQVSLNMAGVGSVPPMLALLDEDPNGWLGRTATGLIVGDRGRSWLAIEGSPAVVRGFLSSTGDDGSAGYLFSAALLVALRSTGVFGLHAAALCIDNRALVLVGESGAGKSTTATALTSVGCHYLGDDGLLIRERSGEVELLAFKRYFRLTDRVLSSFAALKPHLSKLTADNKWQLDASSAFPNQFLSNWLGPTTLLFLERSSQRSSALFPLPLAEATGLLIAQSSSLGMACHPNPRQHLDLLALLASRANIAKLELGSEWLEDPRNAARALLEQTCSFASPHHRRSEAS